MKLEFLDFDNNIGEEGDTTVEYNIMVRDNDKFVSVAPPFVCKDFLTDFFYFYNGNGGSRFEGSIYGFHAMEYANAAIGKKKNRIYLGMRMRTEYDLEDYTEEDEPYQKLDKYDGSYQYFINFFEDALGIPQSEIWYIDDTRTFLVEVPVYWGARPYLISLYALLLRVGLKYENRNQTPIDFVMTMKGNSKDVMFLKKCRDNISLLLQGVTVNQTFNHYKTIQDLHGSSGIVSIGADITMGKFNVTKSPKKFVLAEEGKLEPQKYVVVSPSMAVIMEEEDDGEDMPDGPDDDEEEDFFPAHTD